MFQKYKKNKRQQSRNLTIIAKKRERKNELYYIMIIMFINERQVFIFRPIYIQKSQSKIRNPK